MEFWRTSELRALRQMEGCDAMTVAAAQGEDRKVQDDLREILAEARREARG